MTATLPVFSPQNQRDLLWDQCRNNLGIARLLIQERRPEPMVATACRMAVETACRAALEQAGYTFDGDVRRALGRLSAPVELQNLLDAGSGSDRLMATQAVVEWLAAYLRSEAPGRSWGY